MADENVVGEYESLVAQEGRRSISLIFIKFISVVVFAGATCYLFLGNFNAWTPGTEKYSLSLGNQDALKIRPLMNESSVKEEQLKKEICDLSLGEWIPNLAGPAYTDKTCKLIPGYVNCLKNGRPDRGYLQWRWKPRFCDLPPFDPMKFLHAMSNKSWAFIGDSILQNHVDSLLCLLSQVEQPHRIYVEESSGIMTWHFPSHNFKIYNIFSPLLVQYETIDKSKRRILHLDIVDSKWTRLYNQYDYVLIGVGQWFYGSSIIFEKNHAIGCHNCPDLKLKEYGADKVYGKALQLSFNFIATSEHKPFVIFRALSPNHFEDGESRNKRVCNRTGPSREGEISIPPRELSMREVEVKEFEKAAAIGARNGVRMELLDTYHPSLLRPDGHPGPYKTYPPVDEDEKRKVKNDCFHWCVPGPIDAWNDMLMKMVISGDTHVSVSSLF